MLQNHRSPHVLQPVLCNKRHHCNEKPMLTANRESPHTATKTKHSQKIIKFKKILEIQYSIGCWADSLTLSQVKLKHTHRLYVSASELCALKTSTSGFRDQQLSQEALSATICQSHPGPPPSDRLLPSVSPLLSPVTCPPQEHLSI